MKQYAGADWLDKLRQRINLPPLTPLGRVVTEILGAVYRGIYHLDSGEKLRKKFVDHGYYVEVILPRSMSTYDFSELTELVILCHAYSVRLEICPHTFRDLKLMFHQRKPPQPKDEVHMRHPSLSAVLKRMEIKPSKFYKLPEPEKIDAPAEKAPV